MARRNVRLLRHKTEESSGKLILISHGDRDGGSQCAPGVRTIFGPNVERC